MNHDLIDPAPLDAALIDEVTDIVFGPLVEPIACDVIFVFGGLDPGLWEKGADAYSRRLGKHVVVTGGYKPTAATPYWKDGTREALIIRRELIILGVPEAAIFYEDRSTNSLENVLFAKEVYDFTKVTSVLAVCKCYGAGRQCRTLKQNLDPGIRVIPYPFDTQIRGRGPVITRSNWMNFAESRSFALEQVTKIYRYSKHGDLVPIEHMSPRLEAIVKVIAK
jgi:uncharacterized SAM-binding protein YcdF (DUF218 family)